MGKIPISLFNLSSGLSPYAFFCQNPPFFLACCHFPVDDPCPILFLAEVGIHQIRFFDRIFHLPQQSSPEDSALERCW